MMNSILDLALNSFFNDRRIIKLCSNKTENGRSKSNQGNSKQQPRVQYSPKFINTIDHTKMNQIEITYLRYVDR